MQTAMDNVPIPMPAGTYASIQLLSSISSLFFLTLAPWPLYPLLTENELHLQWKGLQLAFRPSVYKDGAMYTVGTRIFNIAHTIIQPP